MQVKKILAVALACVLLASVPAAFPMAASADAPEYKYAEEMMDDFLAAFLRDHTNEAGEIVGKSTWRWSNNPDNGGGVTSETRRETDFWLSAHIFESVNDALQYTKDPKYAALLSQLYDSFIGSRWHPTWDVHVWDYNSYNDDLCWWTQAMLRAHELTGEQKYLTVAEQMLNVIWENGYDAVQGNYGGAPYGGILWRRNGAGIVNTARQNNQKNVCTNGNYSLCASRFALYYKDKDPAKAAEYEARAKLIYEWATAHLLKNKETGYVIDNISYSGSESASQYTYNYGCMADAAYELYLLTGEQQYLDTAKLVLGYGWRTLTISDGLTVKDEGSGDSAGFKLILARYTGYMINHGGLDEFKMYLDANAYQAYNHRRASDGLNGSNLSFTPKEGTGIASPCAVLGPVLLYYSGLDPTVAPEYPLYDLADPIDGVYQAEFALAEYMAYNSDAAGYTGTGFTQYWDADGPHREDGYVDFSVTVPKTAVYKLTFRWYTRGNNTRRLTINGSPAVKLSFVRLAANQWETFDYYAFLKEGVNSVKMFYNNPYGHPNDRDADSWFFLDYLKVDESSAQNVGNAEEMMEDFLAAYLRQHYDEDGNPAGLSTWRWTDNPDKGGGSTYEKRRETDFWLSALILDTLNDALEYSKNPKYIDIIDGLYASFIESQWHPTWDVHDWTVNTYTDDLCWWAQSFERSYRLTGDSRYLNIATQMWDEIMKSWDETPGYGGEPYGGFFWRRTAGGNVVNPLNATKNVCSNLNSVMAAARLSKDFAAIDPAKSAAYAAQAKAAFAWAKAHLLREDGYIYDNVAYNGNRSTGQYTYNYGNFAGAAYELYTITGDQAYMDTCLLVLRYAFSLTKEGTKFVQADGLTITGSEGTGDGAGFKMILFRNLANIVYGGGVMEFEKYLTWNAEKAWTNRRMTDGLCGVNLLTTPTTAADLASPCSALGPALAYYTHLDMDADFGVSKEQLMGNIDTAKALDGGHYSPQSFAALAAEIAAAESLYADPNAPGRRMAAAVYRIDKAVSGLRLINHPDPLILDGANPAAFELEDGVFTDSVSASSAVGGYSGTGYLAGFTTDAQSGYQESVSFDVDAKSAGRHDLALRAAVYLKDEAYRKPRTYNYTTGYGHQIDVTDGERDSYWPAGPIGEATPARWLQIDLQNPTEINMVRIRIRNNQSSRQMDFSLWGGLDKDNLVELKATQRYQFTRVGTNTTYSNAGNYADVEFAPTRVRYLRVVFTYTSVAAGNAACEVAEFEAYAPVRTAALYVDGVKAKDIVMPVNTEKLTGASWETKEAQWQDFLIEDIYLTQGTHQIAVVSEGSSPDKYTLDKISFPNLFADWSIADDKAAGSLKDCVDNAYTGFLIFATYDREGRLVYTETKAFSIDAGEKQPFEFTADTAAYPAEYTYKVFCWNRSFVPLI
ncbi:MAG: discoidin domain-containing protein [Oscillospiraceae bacterium]|jgi:rhamnogalacturonyl hydrolase YesR|nr:discoidin domain-containing protein [Oscillospiraceae bacterium]